MIDEQVYPKAQIVFRNSQVLYHGVLAIMGLIILSFTILDFLKEESIDLLAFLVSFAMVYFTVWLLEKKIDVEAVQELGKHGCILLIVLALISDSVIIANLAIITLHWHLLNVIGSRQNSVRIHQTFLIMMLSLYFGLQALDMQIAFESGLLFLGSGSLLMSLFFSNEPTTWRRGPGVTLEDVRVSTLILLFISLSLVFKVYFTLIAVSIFWCYMFITTCFEDCRHWNRSNRCKKTANRVPIRGFYVLYFC